VTIPVLTGLDRVVRNGLALPGKGRIGLLCNATTVASDWTPAPEAIARVPGVRLERIFSPQHGFASEKQDNMIASADGAHSGLGAPIVSLYGERREPLPEAFDGLDALIIDLQDVGTRVYTFLVTALLAMRVAAARGVPVIVLDRPNPIGGTIEGPVLEDGLRSFVGIVDVPLRHGLTAAEFCLYGAWRLGLLSEADAARAAESARASKPQNGPVRVIALQGWRRSLYYDETGLPWTMPSPNMPSLETAAVYPGQVVLEATNLSEGRGTTRPFELFGAPYLDPSAVRAALAPGALDGAVLREVGFEPTFHKHAGSLVRGFQVHVLDRRRFRPVFFTTALLRAVREVHPQAFAWREPPYEYEWDRVPADLVYGTSRVREAIDALAPAEKLARSWEPETAAFRERVRRLWLYDE
jgi:uncharacterized protein YbbC (DUF1343 family)